MNWSVFQETKKWGEKHHLWLEAWDKVDSTNTRAKTCPKHTGLVLANSQEAGRGRFSRTWMSPPKDTALLGSWFFDVDRAPQPIITLRVGLALFESAQQIWPELTWALKAPNDLYLNEKKVAGLLLESVSSGASHRWIVGLGFNIWDKPEKMDLATSLAQHLQPTCDEWHNFLENFHASLGGLQRDVGSEGLSSLTRQSLQKALNRWKGLSEPIVDIDETGVIRLANGQVYSWDF